jgi:hypothetical protein
MKPKILLRIAAILMLLHAIGHSFGALGWTKAPNTQVATVITGMQQEHFDFMGRSATIGQFYTGYGVSMIFMLLFISAQLWLLSNQSAKPQLALMAIFLLILAVCEYRYFFPLAALLTFLAALCGIVAYINTDYRKT